MKALNIEKENAEVKLTYLIGFLLILLTCFIYLYRTLPAQNEYHALADEGTYYRQADNIIKYGLSEGIKQNTTDYLTNVNYQTSPNPCRILNNVIDSIFLRLDDSYQGLSYGSLYFFFALLISLFLFFEKAQSSKFAFFLTMLVLFSPLANGMARRALTDSTNNFFMIWLIILFYNVCTNPSKMNNRLYAVCLALCILLKESTLFILPFFFLFHFYLNRTKEKRGIVFRFLILNAIPVFISFTAIIIFVGFNNVEQIIHILFNTRVDYIIQYGSGPWYQYLIDFMILSPITALLFFTTGLKNVFGKEMNYSKYLVILFIYSIFVYSFLLKDIRFLLFLDLPIRFIAVKTLLEIKWPEMKMDAATFKNALPFVCLGIICYADWHSFHKLFVEGKIYDPVIFNLLKANSFIP